MKKIFLNNDIWHLLDERAGNRSQVLGVANALNNRCVETPFQYNDLSRFPHWLLQKTIIHLKT